LRKEQKKRVLGVLLGEVRRGKHDLIVDATNSFAIPFEEDEQNATIWFLDHNYLENMAAMYRKVNARENIVGWYSTGPDLRQSDLDINELFRKYTSNPAMVIIDVQPKLDFELPTKSYVSVAELKDGNVEAPVYSFEHIASEIGALEAEEVGVEHLLRDVKDISISTLSNQVSNKIVSLKSLISHLKQMQTYLQDVTAKKLPLNHEILAEFQEIFNLAPNLNIEELAKSFAIKSNDMMVVIYLSSLVRSIIALHSLINNKLDLQEKEKEDEKKEKKRRRKRR